MRARSPKRCCAKAGLAHKSRDGVRLLGKGDIKAKIEIEVAGASRRRQRRGRKGRRHGHHHLQEEGLRNKKGEPGKRQKRRAEFGHEKGSRAEA